MTSRLPDAWGRVTLKPDDAVELLYQGHDICDFLFEKSLEIDDYNEWCEIFSMNSHIIGKQNIMTNTPEQEHFIRSNDWSISSTFKDMDVRQYVLSLCKTETEISRVTMEMDLFDQNGLLDMLKMCMTLVEHFRDNDIVWGCGRGSSVSSYVLYLIGIHKIDSLLYDLDFREFLKE